MKCGALSEAPKHLSGSFLALQSRGGILSHHRVTLWEWQSGILRCGLSVVPPSLQHGTGLGLVREDGDWEAVFVVVRKPNGKGSYSENTNI